MTPKYRRILFLGREKNIRPLPSLLEPLLAVRDTGAVPLLDKSIINIVGAEMAEVFAQHGIAVHESDAAPDVDLVVVLGGDGTFIGAARHYAPHNIELIGINLGYLGFLTDIASDYLQRELLSVLEGKCHTEERFMFSITLNGATPPGEDLSVAINDVVISRGDTGTLLTLRVFVNDVFAYDLRADGLIISTPSGSTAYALSAGGPIVAPALDAILMVPLCPHSLTHRPLMVPAGYPIRVQVVGGQEATVHIDGHGDFPLAADDVIEVSRHPAPLKICHPVTYDYYQTLRKKFLWGG